MSFEEFKTIIKTLDEEQKKSLALYKLGVDLNEHNDSFLKIIDILLESTFGLEGTEWIYWYLYERRTHSGKILKAHDADGKEICHTLESLWETVCGAEID